MLTRNYTTAGREGSERASALGHTVLAELHAHRTQTLADTYGATDLKMQVAKIDTKNDPV